MPVRGDDLKRGCTSGASGGWSAARHPTRCGGRLDLRGVLRVGGENQFTHRLLRGEIAVGRAQQCERAALAVDAVLPCRERDVATVARATLPDPEADQLEAGQGPLREVQ